MKLGIVGLGYIGSVTAAVLASKEHDVVGLDIDVQRIKNYNKGILPIYEPGLSDLLKQSVSKIIFTTEFSDLSDCDAVFVCVPTPTVSGKINLDYVESACKSIAECSPKTIIIIKSTVIPGTAARIMNLRGVEVISNPEFTREGTAVNDTITPDRVVIGSRKNSSYDFMRKVWWFVESPFVETTNENAELIKYASNAFLATKISFINEIANLCEKIPNADVTTVALGMGLDPRIGKDFLRAGLGFGGSCFPKDTEALTSFANDLGERTSIVESAISVNLEREDRIVSLCKKALGDDLNGRKICVLGLSFKEDTDDLRESKSIKLFNALRATGASVEAFDPMIKSDRFPYACDEAEDCLKDSELAVISTEWPHFSAILESYNGIVIDARRIVPPSVAKKYLGVGKYNK